MIHPADYVHSLLMKGETKELIKIIREFRDNLDRHMTEDHATVYRFSTAFLTSVVGQLHKHIRGQDIHSDPVLAVWAEHGYFGVSRERIPENQEY